MGLCLPCLGPPLHRCRTLLAGTHFAPTWYLGNSFSLSFRPPPPANLCSICLCFELIVFFLQLVFDPSMLNLRFSRFFLSAHSPPYLPWYIPSLSWDRWDVDFLFTGCPFSCVFLITLPFPGLARACILFPYMTNGVPWHFFFSQRPLPLSFLPYYHYLLLRVGFFLSPSWCVFSGKLWLDQLLFSPPPLIGCAPLLSSARFSFFGLPLPIAFFLNSFFFPRVLFGWTQPNFFLPCALSFYPWTFTIFNFR